MSSNRIPELILEEINGRIADKTNKEIPEEIPGNISERISGEIKKKEESINESRWNSVKESWEELGIEAIQPGIPKSMLEQSLNLKRNHFKFLERIL